MRPAGGAKCIQGCNGNGRFDWLLGRETSDDVLGFDMICFDRVENSPCRTGAADRLRDLLDRGITDPSLAVGKFYSCEEKADHQPLKRKILEFTPQSVADELCSVIEYTDDEPPRRIFKLC
jgi:hypothetical protein